MTAIILVICGLLGLIIFMKHVSPARKLVPASVKGEGKLVRFREILRERLQVPLYLPAQDRGRQEANLPRI